MTVGCLAGLINITYLNTHIPVPSLSTVARIHAPSVNERSKKEIVESFRHASAAIPSSPSDSSFDCSSEHGWHGMMSVSLQNCVITLYTASVGIQCLKTELSFAFPVKISCNTMTVAHNQECIIQCHRAPFPTYHRRIEGQLNVTQLDLRPWNQFYC